jgi:hypothetical protein
MTTAEFNVLDRALSKIAGLSDNARDRENLRFVRTLRIRCAGHHADRPVAATEAGWIAEFLDELLSANERISVVDPQRLAHWPGCADGV